MDHFKDGKLWPCVLGGVAVGATLATAVGHIWQPSWCTPTKKPKSLKITYFNIEGVVEKVRLALVVAGIPFEDHRIAFSEWQQLKPTSKYGQLPLMYIDGGEPIAQSSAMLMYAAKLCPSLYPRSKQLLIDEVLGVAGDFDKAWAPCLYLSMRPFLYGYPSGFNKTDEGQALIKRMREAFVADGLKRFLGYYTKFIQESGDQFLCGSEVTIADLTVLPQLKRFISGTIDYVPVDCLDSHPVVVAWMKRVMAIPAIDQWYASKK